MNRPGVPAFSDPGFRWPQEAQRCGLQKVPLEWIFVTLSCNVRRERCSKRHEALCRGSPGVENRFRIKKTDAFDHRRAGNRKITRPFRAPPKWRSHFVLAARRTRSDTLASDLALEAALHFARLRHVGDPRDQRLAFRFRHRDERAGGRDVCVEMRDAGHPGNERGYG